MIRAQQGAEIANAVCPAVDCALVKIVAENVDAVRASEIVEAVAVEIGDGHALGRLHKGADREAGAHLVPVLEWHAVSAGELQIGDVVGGFGSLAVRFGESRPVKVGKPLETRTTALRDIAWRTVGTKELFVAVLVEREERCDASCHPGVPGKRAVFGLRQFETALDRAQRRGDRRRAGTVKSQADCTPWHRIGVYPEHLTKP